MARRKRVERTFEKDPPSSVAVHHVGRKYRVHWNGGVQTAVLLSKRYSERLQAFSYYLHYEGFDNRLDEWRDSSAFVSLDTLPSSQSKSEAEEFTKIETAVTDPGGDPTPIQTVACQPHVQAMVQASSIDNVTEEAPKLKVIDAIEFGDYEIKTWYYSPFPEEYKDVAKLYVCEHCLKYMRYSRTMEQHAADCKARCPPGQLVYDCLPIRIYEVDGKINKLYCQNLSLLSKLFIDHKTVFYDIEPFNFYVLCEVEQTRGSEVNHVVGCFSKEKHSYEGFNLACIMVLPPFQRKGYGRLLIEFSYELSKLEKKIGLPERPLSDLGFVGYQSYWQSTLLRLLNVNAGQSFSIRDIAESTSISPEDIVSTLSGLGLLRYWKDEKRAILTLRQIEDTIRAHKVKLNKLVRRSCINWTPPSKS